MKKITWIALLTCRKLWMSIASFVVVLMLTLGKDEASAIKAASLIIAIGSVASDFIEAGLTDSQKRTNR